METIAIDVTASADVALATTSVLDGGRAAAIVVTGDDPDSGGATPVTSLELTADADSASTDGKGNGKEKFGDSHHLIVAAHAAAAEVAAALGLTAERLAPVIKAAKRLWVASGRLDADQAARLADAVVDIADLDGLVLGDAVEGKVIVDADAAGYGWFVDSAPEGGGVPDNAALGSMDVLTVVSTGLGYAVGVSDARDAGSPQTTLAAGERRLPTDAAAASSIIRLLSLTAGNVESSGASAIESGSAAQTSGGGSTQVASSQVGSVESPGDAETVSATSVGPVSDGVEVSAGSAIDLSSNDGGSPASPETAGGLDTESSSPTLSLATSNGAAGSSASEAPQQDDGSSGLCSSRRYHERRQLRGQRRGRDQLLSDR